MSKSFCNAISCDAVVHAVDIQDRDGMPSRLDPFAYPWLGCANFMLLEAIRIPELRDSIVSLIEKFAPPTITRAAIYVDPFDGYGRLWSAAIAVYSRSGSYLGSEYNFQGLIAPFFDLLSSQKHDQLLDATVGNGRNWDAVKNACLAPCTTEQVEYYRLSKR
jgi:hypothetical protein